MKGIFEREREEGREEGRGEGRAQMIVQFLRRRFQTVPKTLEKKLLSIHSSEMLDEIVAAVMDSQSIREFTTRLKEIQQYGGALATSGK